MSEKLKPSLYRALADCAYYSGRGQTYWWRPKSMQKLAEIGFVEQWVPPSLAERHRMKSRPWRITDAGRKALEAQ